MSVQETLRITLPRAIDIGNDQLAARAYPLRIVTNTGSNYVSSTVLRAQYTPTQIPVQMLHIMGGGTEIEQVMGANGQIAISFQTNLMDYADIVLYNLSVYAEAHITLYFSGELEVGKKRNVPWS